MTADARGHGRSGSPVSRPRMTADARGHGRSGSPVGRPRLTPVHEVLLAIVLSTNMWPGFEIQLVATVFVCIAIVLAGRQLLSLPVTALSLVALLGVVGSIGMATGEWLPIDAARDAASIARIAALLVIGLVIGLDRYSLPQFLRAFVLAGTLDAVIHLGSISTGVDLTNAGLSMLRSEVSKGSLTEVLALCILLLWKRAFEAGGPVRKGWRYLLIILLSCSIGLYFSRTILLGVAIILLIALLVDARHARRGLRRRRNRSGWVAGVGAVGVVVGLMAVIAPPALLEDFLDRSSGSFQELTPSAATSVRQVTLDYRAFEAYRAIETYQSGNPPELILGRGWGYSVDLLVDTASSTAANARTEAPVLHNGYLFLLVKTGVVGVIIYVALLGLTIRRAWRITFDSGPPRLIGDITIGSVLLTAFATTVVSGLLNMQTFNSITILMGVAIALAAKNRGQHG